MSHVLNLAKQVFDIEAQAILRLKTLIDNEFEAVVHKILTCSGKLVVTGMGKSGHVGQKIAATLASTGTPSFFMHPAEAFHGDLGMVSASDVILGISYSGETEELVRLLPILKERGNAFIALCGRKNSTLALHSDFVLNASVEREACPLQLAPTASTTAALAMGDALAVALMSLRHFKAEDFARFHPGGSLGRKLLTKVKDLMHKELLPIVQPQQSITDLIVCMSGSKYGMAIVQEAERVVGLVTDGDLRRAINKHTLSGLQTKFVGDIMTRNPRSIAPENTISDAEALFFEHKITHLLVLQGTLLVGILQVYDLNKL